MRGKGLDELRATPASRSASGLLENEARELNIGFVSRMTRGRPWVRMKIAASLDGKTALIERQEPVDHRRGGAPRRASLARARVRGADRHRHGARRRPAAHGARGADDAPAAARGGGQQAGDAARRRRYSKAAGCWSRRRARTRRQIAALKAKGAEVIVMPNSAGKVELGDLVPRAGAARNERSARRGRLQAERLAAARRAGGRAAGLSRARH